MKQEHKDILTRLYNILMSKEQVTRSRMIDLVDQLFPEYRDLDLGSEIEFLFN